MSNVLNIEKPCTIVCKFSNSDESDIWKVSNMDRVFHYREFKEPPIEAKISFPRIGKYYSNKEIESIKTFPLETFDIISVMPKTERDYNPENIYVEKVQDLANTPARTWAKEGYIQAGSVLDTYPSQWAFFILLHELGHQKYFTEWKTDLFALYQFLKLGYNESQAFYALSKILNRKPDNIERIKNLYNVIVNK